MKKKEKTKVAKYLANELNLAHHGVLAYRVVSHNGFKCIVGIFVDTISFKPEGFRLYFFAQCMFIPVEFYDLSTGALDYIQGTLDDITDADFIEKIRSTYQKYAKINTLNDIISNIEKHIIPYAGGECCKWELFAYI